MRGAIIGNDDGMTDGATRQAGTLSLDEAFAHARAMLGRDPALALGQAREILRAVPGHPQAVLIEGQALSLLGQLAPARDVLARL
ncbi:hypothetical protein, partial [Enterococcus faecalis]|uniref:hypothetical protein n=1 Tax=Enterococcus faecalis TaxID=1351 RepID=UPI00403FB694